MNRELILHCVFVGAVVFMIALLSAICVGVFYFAWFGEWFAISAVVFSYYIGYFASSIKKSKNG